MVKISFIIKFMTQGVKIATIQILVYLMNFQNHFYHQMKLKKMLQVSKTLLQLKLLTLKFKTCFLSKKVSDD